jgi:hypothetical protein
MDGLACIASPGTIHGQNVGRGDHQIHAKTSRWQPEVSPK